jgi:cytochrome P450
MHGLLALDEGRHLLTPLVTWADDIARTPNDHVSFGFGPHYCLGAHLTYVQMRAVFTELLPLQVERMGDHVRATESLSGHFPMGASVPRSPRLGTERC